MSQMTYRQIVQEAGAMLDLDTTAGSETDTSLKRYVNLFGRRLWTSRPWRERRAELVVATVAPYSTGTASITEGTAALTGSGTTWTGFEARKFALGYSEPIYRVSSVGGATAITLARNYLEGDVSGGTYVIYQDEYDLTSAVDSVTSATLLYNSRWGEIAVVPQTQMDAEAAVGATSGKPLAVCLVTSTTAGTRRIRFSPVPDDTYAVVVKYLKAWTDLSGDSDVPSIPQNAEYLLLLGTALMGQRIANVGNVTSEAEIESLIQRLWNDQGDTNMTVHRRTFDQASSPPMNYWRVVD